MSGTAYTGDMYSPPWLSAEIEGPCSDCEGSGVVPFDRDETGLVFVDECPTCGGCGTRFVMDD